MTNTTSGAGSFLLVVVRDGNIDDVRRHIADSMHWRRSSDAPIPAVQVEAVGNKAIVATTAGAVVARGARGICVGQFDLLKRRDRPVGQTAVESASRVLGDDRWDDGSVEGGFAYCTYDPQGDAIRAATDLLRSYPLFYAHTPGFTVVATDLQLILATGLVERRLSNSSVYHFLNLSYVPTPFTMFEGVSKLPRASTLRISATDVQIKRYWNLAYSEDEDVSDLRKSSADLRAQMERAVLDARPDGEGKWGAFLSGGTDSSSIAGILARNTGSPVHTFSIGFAEAGFDELGYAQVAARHFGLMAHTHVVSAEETLKLIPEALLAYDEPPGNASCIPTMACTRLARSEGMSVLLGGDGGDEIFGGNERYRKDAILQKFYQLPRPVKGAAGLIAGLGGNLDWRPWNRVRNFVSRGSIPNPDRFYTDDAFASEFYGELLTRDFQAAVSQDATLDHMRSVYARISAPSELHRLMELDLEMTIADNDIVKVSRAGKSSGLSVRFPYLDRTLMEFTGRLPAACKVRSGEKRFLFRRAMADLLPSDILRKKKQGFGLPTSVWFREHPTFRALIGDVVCSPRALNRGIFQEAHIRHLVRRHERGAWDHGSEIWYLLMLELWIRKYVEQRD